MLKVLVVVFSECKLGSVSEHILKERLKRDGKNNEQNNEAATK